MVVASIGTDVPDACRLRFTVGDFGIVQRFGQSVGLVVTFITITSDRSTETMVKNVTEVQGLNPCLPYAMVPAAIPILLVRPHKLTRGVGRYARFSSTVIGDNPTALQRKFHGTNLIDGQPINGSQSDTLFISRIGPSDLRSYRLTTNTSFGLARVVAAPFALNSNSSRSNPVRKWLDARIKRS